MNKKILVLTLTFVLLCSIVPLAVIPVNAADVTTSVTVTKLANDGITILDQVTVPVEDMMDSEKFTIYGDGITHYYHQGPVMDGSDMWDPDETLNLEDYGACMGTDAKELCDLVGGASAGDEIKFKAPDGFFTMVSYADVYTPEAAQGKVIVTWYSSLFTGSGSGYVTDGSYETGMRLVFFAETTNSEGQYVFGNWDIHETLAEQYWHYFTQGGVNYPSSGGLSVKWVSCIIIYSSEEPQSSPTPTQSPESTPTPSPTPESTATPQATSTPTASPESTPSPEPTFAPEIPEFPWGLILLLVIIGILVSLIIYRKNATTKRKLSNGSEK